ncbi:lipid II-degrading bacteriocin [Enterobacter sp. R1(2018)]|nr:lipid II-degrading bacteriocin [Enterobacter sp. R1(2018)]
MNWLVDYVKTHNLNDPNVQKIISGNIGLFCNADRKLVGNPGMMVMSAFGSDKAYNYAKENIPQMSGNVTTPIVALAHYLWEMVKNVPYH